MFATRSIVDSINVLAQAHSPAGNPLSVVSVGPAAYGLVMINPDNTVTYLRGFTYPLAPFLTNYTDSFTYTVADGKGGTATGTNTIDVDFY
jgi:large repetitive protein